MDFLDGITKKVKLDKGQYKPAEYEFSDGEGVEEDEIEEQLESNSDQDGFDSEGGEVSGKGKKQKKTHVEKIEEGGYDSQVEDLEEDEEEGEEEDIDLEEQEEEVSESEV